MRSWKVASFSQRWIVRSLSWHWPAVARTVWSAARAKANASRLAFRYDTGGHSGHLGRLPYRFVARPLAQADRATVPVFEATRNVLASSYFVCGGSDADSWLPASSIAAS